LGKIQDITGQRFGRLVVTGYHKEGKNRLLWVCICDCGNEKILPRNRLVDGQTRSCGCFNKDSAHQRQLKDMTGKKFTRLTVTATHIKRGKATAWLCICDCGKEVYVNGGNLRNGQIKSCGCYKDENTSKRRRSNLVGRRFGRLVVTSVAEAGRSGLYWNCLCDCGNTNKALTANLTRGNVSSCGCLHLESIPRGVNHPFYNPNIPDSERDRKRTYVFGISEWKRKVKELADFTCQVCKERGGKLVSHHLYSFDKYKELRTDLDNGVCLCESCHKSFHKIYGNGNNTKEQFEQYLDALRGVGLRDELAVSR
jgi:hypothetical protein